MNKKIQNRRQKKAIVSKDNVIKNLKNENAILKQDNQSLVLYLKETNQNIRAINNQIQLSVDQVYKLLKSANKLDQDNRDVENISDVLSSTGYFVEYPNGAEVSIARGDFDVMNVEDVDTTKPMVVDAVIQPSLKYKNQNKEITTIKSAKVSIKNK